MYVCMCVCGVCVCVYCNLVFTQSRSAVTSTLFNITLSNYNLTVQSHGAQSICVRTLQIPNGECSTIIYISIAINRITSLLNLKKNLPITLLPSGPYGLF